MEGWVGLGTTMVSRPKQSDQDRCVTNIAVVSCSNCRASLGKWTYTACPQLLGAQGQAWNSWPLGSWVTTLTAAPPSHCEKAYTFGLSVLAVDAVRWSSICHGDVAVCVSVTLMYCAQTTESIIMRPSPDCSPTILVFPHHIWTR